MMIKVHGIKNCDTLKKAMKWLKSNDLEFTFHDFKKQSLDSSTLNSWVDAVGWEILLNRRGTTWRKLPDNIKNSVDEPSAKSLMLNHLSIIKRPVLDVNGNIHIGFNEARYQEIFFHV